MIIRWLPVLYTLYLHSIFLLESKKKEKDIGPVFPFNQEREMVSRSSQQTLADNS